MKGGKSFIKRGGGHRIFPLRGDIKKGKRKVKNGLKGTWERKRGPLTEPERREGGNYLSRGALTTFSRQKHEEKNKKKKVPHKGGNIPQGWEREGEYSLPKKKGKKRRKSLKGRGLVWLVCGGVLRKVLC